jgi:hypothetical protein
MYNFLLWWLSQGASAIRALHWTVVECPAMIPSHFGLLGAREGQADLHRKLVCSLEEDSRGERC